MLNEINKMLSLTFEIEGLLMMTAERGDMTPPEVYNLIRSKIDRLQMLSATTRNDIPESLNSEISGSENERSLDIDRSYDPVTPVPETDFDAHEPIRDIDHISEGTTITNADILPDGANSITPQVEDIDQKITVSHTAEDIRRNMALNDKFLFRRELFNGDEELFSQTLSLISAMSNMDEVNDYLLNDLCFDLSDPAVSRFSEIIYNSLFK